jgi:DNA-binding transcriptional LysR family regulator
MRKWRSLTALRAFEAVARQGSVSAAAAELNVTRPAISKQIALLERDLACHLFDRSGNRIALTDSGQELCAGLRQAFDLMSATTESVARRASRGERVRVLVCRDFASSWLAGQVGSFLVANPGISVEVTAERNGNFRLSEDFDFRIFYGPEKSNSPPGFAQTELCRWIDMPVCAPGFAESHLRPGQDLAEAPQLVDDNYDVWEDWCTHVGLTPGPARQRTLFNETTLCLSVAASGGGIAIGDSFLALPLIRQGDLIVPFKTGLVSAQTYALFTPLAPLPGAAARRFENWLHRAVADYQSTVLEQLARYGIQVLHRNPGAGQI